MYFLNGKEYLHSVEVIGPAIHFRGWDISIQLDQDFCAAICILPGNLAVLLGNFNLSDNLTMKKP